MNKEIESTKGIIYKVAAGVAVVVGYEGTESDIKIANNYKGVPVKR